MKNEIELSSLKIWSIDSEDLRAATGLDIDDEGNFYYPLGKDLTMTKLPTDMTMISGTAITLNQPMMWKILHTKEETTQRTDDKPSILGQIRAFQQQEKSESRQESKEQQYEQYAR